MLVEWVSLTELCAECNIDKRTFIKNYLDENPPQRQSGHRKTWTRTDANRIKHDVLGIEIQETDDADSETA